MSGYPSLIVPAGHVQPCPRRIRGMFAGRTVFDTGNARYVWERPHYPQYYIPLAEVALDLLREEHTERRLPTGSAAQHGLRVGDREQPGAVAIFGAGPLAGLVRFDWAALDAWYEEDEQIFVHPRCPYSRVDAVRSTRSVRVELAGVLLAESSSPVLVFETGLPTRYYLNRTEVDFGRLVPSDTETGCPYKGTTSGYWSARLAGRLYPDVAWCYDFPSWQLLPIAGLICFYNEKVDLTVDGERQPRPELS
jgi:uncharacterized protein (DUF427 family)